MVAMKISDILAPEALKPSCSVSSKKRLFQEIAEQAATCYGVSAEVTFQALQDRENLGPTCVGRGIGLPHARLESIDKVVAVFCRLEQPINFDAADKQPLDLFFCLLAPEHAGADHLKALALVSRTLRDIETCAKLRANDNSNALYAILTDEPASAAA